MKGGVLDSATGVPRSYEIPPPQDPTVALCLGTCGDPRGVGVCYEQGTPVKTTREFEPRQRELARLRSTRECKPPGVRGQALRHESDLTTGAPRASPASLGFTDSSQVDMLGLRYQFVNSGAGKSPG